jgi:uncharacterized protein
MLRTVVSLSLLILAGVRAAAAQAVSGSDAGSPAVPEIATSGRGEVRAAPDLAIFNVSVDSRSPSVATAAAENASTITRTIAAIRAAGIDSSQITTAGYSVNPDYDKNRPIGFIVRNTLRVEVHRIADVARIIDVAMASGGTQLNQVQFQKANSHDARRTALAMAVSDARSDAETLALAAGGSLGRLLSLTSGPAPSPIGTYSFNQVVVTALGSGQPTPIIPGDLIITAVASGRWQFIPRK